MNHGTPTATNNPRGSRNALLLDSGFGRYLRGLLPKAIANEFLYYQPSVLLWADVLLCDRHALKAEMEWADDGFLVSDLSIRLNQRGVIQDFDYQQYFDQRACEHLRQAIADDEDAAGDLSRAGYTTPERNDTSASTETGVENVNAMLYLSACLGVSHLNTRPAARFYQWKFERWASTFARPDSTREIKALSEVMSISVPRFELFPRNAAFLAAEDTKQHLLEVSAASTRGEATRSAVDEAYKSYLNAWLTYDRSVKPEVVDNFDLIVEMRRDPRVVSLRAFMAQFAAHLVANTADPRFIDEVALRLRREILEVERAVAYEAPAFRFLDKSASILSFPVELMTAAVGVVASAATANPLFAAVGLAPSATKWGLETVARRRDRKFAWHFYLMDFSKKVERADELRMLDQQIKALTKHPRPAKGQ